MSVTFKNTRFDPTLIEFNSIAEKMATSVGYTAKLSIDGQLAELLRLRVVQIIPCSYCLILHTKDALDKGIPPEKVSHLASWRESTMFSEAERLALAYCEALTVYDAAEFPACHESLVPHFDEKAVIINMNLWARLKLAQGQVPVLEGA